MDLGYVGGLQLADQRLQRHPRERLRELGQGALQHPAVASTARVRGPGHRRAPERQLDERWWQPGPGTAYPRVHGTFRGGRPSTRKRSRRTVGKWAATFLTARRFRLVRRFTPERAMGRMAYYVELVAQSHKVGRVGGRQRGTVAARCGGHSGHSFSLPPARRGATESLRRTRPDRRPNASARSSTTR